MGDAMLVEVDGELSWLCESRLKPSDSKIWNRARIMAHMDKDYNPHTAKIVTRKIYQMLGGTFAPVRQPKPKGKVRKITAKKPRK